MTDKASFFNASTAFPLSSNLKIPEQEANMFAPASAASLTVPTFIPPSTCTVYPSLFSYFSVL